MPINASEAVESVFDIDIPALNAAEALNRLAEQTGSVMLFPYDLARARQTNAVRGRYTLLEGLELLLRDTGLSGGLSDKRVVIIAEDEDTPTGKGGTVKKRGLLAATLASLLGYQAIGAEVDRTADSAQAPPTLGEVSVTARRVEENLQDVPISVMVFSAADLRARAVTRLADIGMLTPNLTFTEDEQEGNSAGLIFVRGVGQTDAFITNQPGVGVYVDGVYIARMRGLNLDLVDAERIEVLRGPQGTLFGRNTIGGALNVVSVKPGRDLGGSLEIDVGRFNRVDARASVNLPLIEDRLAAKISVLTANRDGYGARYDFVSGNKIDEMSDVNSLAGRGAISWTPGDNVNVLLSLDGSRVREAGGIRKVPYFQQDALVPGLYRAFVPGVPSYADSAFEIANDFKTYATGGNAYDVDAFGVAGAITWNLSGLTVKSITAYRDLDVHVAFDPDGTPYRVINQADDTHQSQWSQEIQLTGNSPGERFRWVAGLFVFQEDARARENVEILLELRDAIGLDISALHLTDSLSRSYAAFGQGIFSVTNKLLLTGGLRYTTEHQRVTQEILNPFTGSVSHARTSKSSNWSSLSPKVSLEYHNNEDVMTYVSIAQGFKSGGINGRSQTVAEFVPYDPEIIWTYEVGVKSQWFQRRLLLNSTLFYSSYTDMQFLVLGATEEIETVATVGNAAKAEIKGFEIDVALVPTSRLTLGASVGFTDAEFTRVAAEAQGITIDSKFVKTPKWSVNVSAEYHVPVGDIGTLTTNVGYGYKSRTYHDQLSTDVCTQEGFGLVDARVTYEHGQRWEVSGYGTNLSDERYFVACGNLLDVLGWANRNYARPREWGLNLRYKF